MAAAVAKITLDITASNILSAGINAGAIPAKFRAMLDMNSGTSEGQIDLVYAKSESGKTASSTTSYDLAAGVLDIYGSAMTMVEVVLIAIKNKRQTAQATLSIGPHATNGFGALASGRGFWTAAIGSGGGNIVMPASTTTADRESWVVMYSEQGVPVTAGTGDVLAVVCSAVSGDINAWDILVLGRSA
jgi:hypothetical protein